MVGSQINCGLEMSVALKATPYGSATPSLDRHSFGGQHAQTGTTRAGSNTRDPGRPRPMTA